MRKANLHNIKKLPFTKKEIHNDSSGIVEYMGFCDPADREKTNMVIMKVTTPFGREPVVELIAEERDGDGTLFIHRWEERENYKYVPIER